VFFAVDVQSSGCDLFSGCVGGCRGAIFCPRVDNPPRWPEHLLHFIQTSVSTSPSGYLLSRPVLLVCCSQSALSLATHYTYSFVIVDRRNHLIGHQLWLHFLLFTMFFHEDSNNAQGTAESSGRASSSGSTADSSGIERHAPSAGAQTPNSHVSRPTTMKIDEDSRYRAVSTSARVHSYSSLTVS
jgi:hypothetical protein